MDYKILLKKDALLKLFKDGCLAFKELPEELRDDKKIVLDAVRHDNWALMYATERLKKDKEVVLEAVRHNGGAIFFISKKLKNDYDIVLVAVKQNGLLLYSYSEKFQNNKILLEILEKSDTSDWITSDKNWYEERMEVLASLREKELMEVFIPVSGKMAKKNKF